MMTRYVLPLLAVAGMTFAVYTVVMGRKNDPPTLPVNEPPTRPDTVRMIAGSGIVESQMENIPIGTPVAGMVRKVAVKKGDMVKEGQELFFIDDRELQAQLKVKAAELAASKAQYNKLASAPRPEDIPPAKAAVDEAQARLNDAEAAMGRTEKLYNRQMSSASDFDRDRFAYYAARAALAKAKAEFERINRGTWEKDLIVAEAAVKLAESEVEGITTNIDRLTVRAPISGRVLQLNVRPGQYAAATWKEPMIVLGDVDQYHVRVDIDENDLPWFKEGAAAQATLKGRKEPRFDLVPVYVEPYVVPKQSLTGFNSERVDTRVLQAVYAFRGPRPKSIYVGQQMDVYLEAVPRQEGNAPREKGSETKADTKSEAATSR